MVHSWQIAKNRNWMLLGNSHFARLVRVRPVLYLSRLRVHHSFQVKLVPFEKDSARSGIAWCWCISTVDFHLVILSLLIGELCEFLSRLFKAVDFLSILKDLSKVCYLLKFLL